MPPSLFPGEKPLMETSATFEGYQGILLLTDRRLLFYMVEREVMRPEEYAFILEAPSRAIIGATHRGAGLSTLVIELDPALHRGNTKNEFFMIDAHRWSERLAPLAEQNRREMPGAGQGRGVQRVVKNPPVPKATAGKLCLSCMKVVPDAMGRCPYCGEGL